MASFNLNYAILYFALSGNTLWTCIHFSNVQNSLEAYINLIWLPSYEQLQGELCSCLLKFAIPLTVFQNVYTKHASKL